VGVRDENFQILHWMSKPKVEDMTQPSDAEQQPSSAGKQYMTRMKNKVTYAFIILFVVRGVQPSNKRGITSGVFTNSHVIVVMPY
jgi:hypothetical protein